MNLFGNWPQKLKRKIKNYQIHVPLSNFHDYIIKRMRILVFIHDTEKSTTIDNHTQRIILALKWWTDKNKKDHKKQSRHDHTCLSISPCTFVYSMIFHRSYKFLFTSKYYENIYHRVETLLEIRISVCVDINKKFSFLWPLTIKILTIQIVLKLC